MYFIFTRKSSQGQRLLMSQVVALLQFILIIPATEATCIGLCRPTSERSFKSYMRTTMLQERMHCLMLLHVHKEGTDALDMQAVLTEFIGEYCWICCWQADYYYVWFFAICKVSRLCLDEYFLFIVLYLALLNFPQQE